MDSTILLGSVMVTIAACSVVAGSMCLVLQPEDAAAICSLLFVALVLVLFICGMTALDIAGVVGNG